MGAKTELIPLRKYNIKYCKACYSTVNTQCHFYCSCYPKGTPNVSETPNPQGQNQISIKNFVFSPVELNINAGETVVWVNNDSVSHDISGSGFKSPLMSNGQSFSFTFTSTGTFDYICGIHPSMKGKIVVK